MTGQKAIESLPDHVRVGGFDFAIVKWGAHAATAAQRWGECSTIEQMIRVQLNMPTPFKAVDTVLHEITHALYWVYGIHDDDKEERIVGAMASAWMQIYRDNPWLLDWIKDALKPTSTTVRRDFVS